MNPLDVIESLCTTFVQQPSSAGSTCESIEQLLRQVDQPTRPVALRNLLHIELRRLRANGNLPDLDGYLRRFPSDAALVRRVFLEFLAETSLTGAPVELSGSIVREAVPVGTGRGLSHLGSYRLVREIGRGGMGAVYEAVHIDRGHRVALKTLPHVDGASLHRFKREFRSVVDVHHHNLIGYQELEADADHWFFTMDLIEGCDWLSYVRPGNVLAPDRLRACFTQLVSGVMALHRNSIIHRDLKPSNVLVTADGHLLILDFGLVLEGTGDGLTETGMMAGTPAFMAPEQVLGRRATGASDWYAVGVMLYQALGGRLPFTATGSFELLRQKTSQQAPALESVPGGLDALAQLAMGLLATDPADRPQANVIAVAAGECSSGKPVLTAPNQLVGRDAQLRAIWDAFEETRQAREPRALFVSGRSGEGKSSLIELFVDQLRQRNCEVTILSGRCYDRESVPFKALDSLIDALASHMQRLAPAEAIAFIPDDIAFLSQLFPVLNRVGAVSESCQGRNVRLDEQQTRTRAFGAFRQLLARLSRKNVVVLISDDLQWGDPDSAEMLMRCLAQPDAPQVFFVGSYRSDESDHSSFLVRWKEISSTQNLDLRQIQVELSPLDVEQCIELTIRLTGCENENVRRRGTEFAHATGGNPYLLNELIGCFDPYSDSFNAIPIDQVIAHKLDRLPISARDFLDAVAVSGQSLRIKEAVAVARLGQEASSLVTPMRTEKLIRLVGAADDGLLDTYHDKIRETVLAAMDGGHRQMLHRRFVQTIEEALGLTREIIDEIYDGRTTDVPEQIDRIYDLAYHSDAAGMNRHATVYALVAADQAKQQFSQTVIAEQLKIARRNSQDASPRVRFRILFGLGRALSLVGQYAEASETLDEAYPLASGAIEEARVVGIKAEIAHKQGRVHESITLHSEALRRLGHWVPSSTLGYAFALGLEAAKQVGHTYLPRITYRRKRQLPEKDSLTIEIANRNSIVSYYHHGIRMLWTHLKGFNLAERYLPSSALAYAYGLHPAPIAPVGLYARGRKYSDIAISMAQECGDLLIEGHSNAMRSMGAFSSGDYRIAVESGRRGMDLLTRAGDPYLNMIAELHTALSLHKLGEVTEAWEITTNAFTRSVRIGEDASAGASLYALSIISDGNYPFATLRPCAGLHEGDHFSAVCVMTAEGVYALRQQEVGRSVEVLKQAWATATRNFIIMCHTVRALTSLATALRVQAEAAVGTPDFPDRLREAKYYTKQAVRFARMFPDQTAKAHRELGNIHALAGNMPRAERMYAKSLSTAERFEDRYEQAHTRIAQSRLLGSRGAAVDASALNDAEAFVHKMDFEIDQLCRRMGSH